MKKHLTKITIVLVLLLLFFLAKGLGIDQYLTFEQLKSNTDMLQSHVANNYGLSVLLYILIYIAIVSLSLPGATILTLTGGFLFGALVGTLYVNIAATTGAVLAFLVARFILGEWVQKKYHSHLKKFNTELERNGHNYLLTLRFIPVFPFFLINILAGITKIPLRTFAWTTSVGIIPGSFVYAFAGQQLTTVSSLKDIVSFEVILAFVFLGLFALVPAIYKDWRKYHQSLQYKIKNVKHIVKRKFS